MTQADRVYITPPITAPEICEQALHERLKAAGMRLQRVSNDRYLILWHHQCLARDLTLLEAARLIDRALVRP
jgi:hypothetical protein